MREEASDESDSVTEEKSKANTEHASGGSEMTLEQIKARAAGDRNRDSRCHQHHSDDRAAAEDEEISDGPERSLDHWQDEKGDGG